MSSAGEEACKRQRRQLSSVEKDEIRKKLKTDSKKQEMTKIVQEWNTDHPSKPINIGHVTRLRSELPGIADGDAFWKSVNETVTEKLGEKDAKAMWVPVKPCDLPLLDPRKIPWMEHEDITFDFHNSKYSRPDSDDQPSSFKKRDKILRKDFRDFYERTGMVYAPFEGFVGREGRKILHDRDVNNWKPSTTDGMWKVAGDTICKDGQKFHRKLGGVFQAPEKRGGRFNPNMESLMEHYNVHQKDTLSSFEKSLVDILTTCEILYCAVGGLLMTCERKDTTRQQVSIQLDLHPSQMSFLSHVTSTDKDDKKVQMEHMDDSEPGAGALWGLVDGQYGVVVKHSYEMNLELAKIYKFREHVMVHKPRDWTKEAFWNLVANVHLEKMGFADKKRPTPVKIRLEVGKLLFFNFMVVHAGMPYAKVSLRGHMYWAKIAGRCGHSASKGTTMLWNSAHPFYPGWRLIEAQRGDFV